MTPSALSQVKIDISGVFTIEASYGDPLRGESMPLPWLLIDAVTVNRPQLMLAAESVVQSRGVPYEAARSFREPYSGRELVQVTISATTSNLHAVLTVASRFAADLVPLLIRPFPNSPA